MDENGERKYSKMYWWIKLQEDFFDTKEMKKLRRIAGGAVYQLIYLKMQLIAMKNCGRIYFDGIEETFADEIALTLDETPEDVQATLVLLERMGLVKKMSDDTIYLPEAEKNTGSETKWAGKKRDYRRAVAAKKAKAIEEKKATKEDNVRDMSSTCPTEIELEIELDKELSLSGESNAPAPARESVTQDEMVIFLGEYGNVIMKPEEFLQLQDAFPNDYKERIDNLSRYMKSKGVNYDDHYATIMKWAIEDAKKAKRGSGGSSNAFSNYEGQREYTREEYDELELRMRQRRTGDPEKGDT
jgi:predicted phage replisome organizer